MNKFLSITIGAIVVFVGLILLLAWWYEFMFILRGTVPVLFILGGLVAVFAGISELKDTQKSKKKESK